MPHRVVWGGLGDLGGGEGPAPAGGPVLAPPRVLQCLMWVRVIPEPGRPGFWQFEWLWPWGEVGLRSGFSSILTRLWARGPRGHEVLVDREKYAGYVVGLEVPYYFTALVFIETLFPS